MYNKDDDDVITCSPTRICNIYSGLDERRISTGVASPLGKDTSLYLKKTYVNLRNSNLMYRGITIYMYEMFNLSRVLTRGSQRDVILLS